MEQVGDGEYNVMLGTNSDAFRRDWTAAAIPSVRLAAGQHLDGRDLRLTKGVVVSGKVVRADSGKGVANIFVGVHGPDHPATSSMISSARTEADGSYAFRAAPGPNHVYLAAAPPDGYRAPAARDVTIVDGQPLTLDFNLERKPGRPVAGRVVDPDGRPVAGAYLSAEAKDGDTFGAARQTSDERGDFFFEAITPGTLIRGASRGLETPEAVVVNGGEPEVVVRLAKSVRVTLTGVVTDAEGTPLANARVSIIRQAGRFGMSSAHPELTDRQGRYRIAGLVPSGRYTLQVQSPGMGTATAKVELDASKESAEAPPLRIAAVSAPISGVVLDADGRPAAGVSVTLEGDEVDRQATLTDPQGRFEFRVRTGNRFKIRAGTDAPARDVRGGDQDLEIKLK
jgi:protocatechuate 3,4-dioxygenase beta subunit